MPQLNEGDNVAALPRPEIIPKARNSIDRKRLVPVVAQRGTNQIFPGPKRPARFGFITGPKIYSGKYVVFVKFYHRFFLKKVRFWYTGVFGLLFFIGKKPIAQWLPKPVFRHNGQLFSTTFTARKFRVELGD